MDEKNPLQNIDTVANSNPNQLPDLAPPSSNQTSQDTVGIANSSNQSLPNPSAATPAPVNAVAPPSQSPVFAASPPPTPSNLTPENLAQTSSGGGNINEAISYADQTPPKKGLPPIPLNRGLLIVAIATVLILAIGGFAVNELVLNKITTLKMVSDEAQFYLSLSVKEHPQSKKAKELLKKFPAGDKFLRGIDQTISGYIGSADSPLLDIAHYAQEEIFLTRISKADKTEKNTFDYSAQNRLLGIIDTGSNTKAQKALADIEDDKDTFSVKKDTYKGIDLLDIQLTSEKELFESSQKTTPSSRRTISFSPKPRSTFATAMENFLLASDKKSDVEKTVDLAKTKKYFGFGNGDGPKSIQDSDDHQKIARYFPKDTFLKYFQRQPISGYNLGVYNPVNSPNLSAYPNSSEEDAQTYQKMSLGMDLVFRDDGAKFNTYLLDWFEPNKSAHNSFKISDSLANKLPMEFAGVGPTIYFETKDLKGQYETQVKMLEKLAEDSKNRNQRDQIKRYLDSEKEQEKSYEQIYGIDYKEDFLSWMDGHIAAIVNLGNAKKGPEFLAVASIKDKTKVENSLKKLRFPQLNSFYSSYGSEEPAKLSSPTPTAYNGINIYQIVIFEYDKIKYSIYFTVTGTKAILGISDSDQSFKEIIDAEKGFQTPLTKNAAWQKQFDKVQTDLVGLSFVEPVKLLGLFDYLKSFYPEYSESAGSLYGINSSNSGDLETILKAYLKTIRSIGAIASKEKPVYINTTFINVVELSKTEKKDAEAAMDRLFGKDRDSDYKSVLGINTSNESKARNAWESFYHKSLRPLLRPNPN